MRTVVPFLRRNPDSVVIPFDTQAFEVRIDPSDSVLSLAERLARYEGDGNRAPIETPAGKAVTQEMPSRGKR